MKAGTRGSGVVLSCLCLLLLCEARSYKRSSRAAEKKASSNKTSKARTAPGTRLVPGDRRPWEDRQEVYDWDFKQVHIMDYVCSMQQLQC